MDRFYALLALVEKWAEERGLFQHGTALGQALKTIEESLELAQAILADDKEKIVDAIGDVLVTIIIQARMQGVSLTDCLEQAYREIANRKGKIEGGQFIKDSIKPRGGKV